MRSEPWNYGDIAVNPNQNQSVMEQNNPLLPEDFSEWHPAEQRAYLRENADNIKQDRVRRPLSPEQISDAEKKLAMKSLELRKQQAEYDRVKKQWRDETIDPLKEDVEALLDTLENKAEIVYDQVYYIRDYENEMVYGLLYDGTQVDRRPMLNEEKQSTIQSAVRKVDNNN